MLRQQLASVWSALEEWLTEQRVEAQREGHVAPKAPVELHIVGQCALLLSDLDLSLTSTTDLDAIGTIEYAVQRRLQELLAPLGLRLESDQHLIWMPTQTRYQPLHAGALVHVDVAEPTYVIASKCRCRRARDRRLIQEFLARYPESRDHIAGMGIDLEWVTR